MNKSILGMPGLLALSGAAHAQSSLSQQIEAVDAAQQRARAAQEAAYQAAAERAARVEAERRAALAAQERQRAAAAQAAHEEALADKKRDQGYEDKLRDLQVQERTLELERLKTRVARENDFIDHDLKLQDARTDVVQSGADATRSLADGIKSKLQGEGAGAAMPKNVLILLPRDENRSEEALTRR